MDERVRFVGDVVRQLPRKLPAITYPAHFELRYVSANGGIRWHCAWVNVTTTLIEAWCYTLHAVPVLTGKPSIGRFGKMWRGRLGRPL